MLVISRKEHESFKLDTSDGEITVEIVRLSGGKVRVGITAPYNVRIFRSELEASSPAAKHVPPEVGGKSDAAQDLGTIAGEVTKLGPSVKTGGFPGGCG